MDAIEALQECKKHWEWLAKNPKKGKSEYFLDNGLSEVDHDCYLCELMDYGNLHDKDTQEAVCDGCPLKGYAWSFRCYRDGDDDPGGFSYYSDWQSGWLYGSHYKSKMALKMVEACDKAIDDLVKKNGR